jgi:hypothetical protein
MRSIEPGISKYEAQDNIEIPGSAAKAAEPGMTTRKGARRLCTAA